MGKLLSGLVLFVMHLGVCTVVIGSTVPKHEQKYVRYEKEPVVECTECDDILSRKPYYHDQRASRLMHATLRDRLDLIDVCLERGDDMEAQDEIGYPALRYGVSFVYPQDSDTGLPLLHLPYRLSCNKAFYYLLSRGADYSGGPYAPYLHGLGDDRLARAQQIVENRLYWLCRGFTNKSIPQGVIISHVLPYLYHTNYINGRYTVNGMEYFKSTHYLGREGGKQMAVVQETKSKKQRRK